MTKSSIFALLAITILTLQFVDVRPEMMMTSMSKLTNASLRLKSDRAIGKTSGELVSFNLDWHENSEETPVWINMSAMVLDLNNPKLREAARAMAPARLRIGGSEGDVVCYDVPTYGSTCSDMNQTDPDMCLGVDRFEALGQFAADMNLELVFGLNAVWGRKNHSLDESLDLSNVRALLSYAAARVVPLFGVELGNEKCGPPPGVFAQDYRNLQALLRELWPTEGKRPKLIGNDCNTNPTYLKEWLPLLNDSVLDVLTYHRYVGYGLDPDLASKIMTPAFLDEALSADIINVHHDFAPSSELWIGEGAAAWHSGRANVTDAFVSSFWWADALGRLAMNNHTSYQRQTLIGGSYGLLDRQTFEPNPDYYVGLLFKRLMGDAVLELSADPVGDGRLRLYAHCLRGRRNAEVSILAINIANDTTYRLTGSTDVPILPRDEYVFTAASLESRIIELNGVELRTSVDGSLPALKPRQGSETTIDISPRSIVFAVLRGIDAPACLS